jgi:penicillin amidase
MNSPGQSGRLGDPHTMDLFEPWARGEAFPLAYTRERVDQVTEHLITLVPPPDCPSPAPGRHVHVSGGPVRG